VCRCGLWWLPQDTNSRRTSAEAGGTTSEPAAAATGSGRTLRWSWLRRGARSGCRSRQRGQASRSGEQPLPEADRSGCTAGTQRTAQRERRRWRRASCETADSWYPKEPHFGFSCQGPEQAPAVGDHQPPHYQRGADRASVATHHASRRVELTSCGSMCHDPGSCGVLGGDGFGG
jgi:hypothetical protein